MTPIYFVLDRSGSMHCCVNDTLGGFNHFVSSQKKDNPNGTMTLVLFAHDFEVLYENKNIQEVHELDGNIYFPRGSTSLLDAIGSTIKKAEKESDIPTIVILTDGEENTSKQFTHLHVKDLIDMKKKEGWNFVFLGANQDAIQVGGNIGIPEESAMTFDQENTLQAFEGLSSAVGRQTSGREEHVTFTGFERAASQGPVTPDFNSEVFIPSSETVVSGTDVFVGN